MNIGVPQLQMSLSNVTAALSRTQIAFRPEGFDTALQTSTPEDRRCLSQNELRFKPEPPEVRSSAYYPRAARIGAATFRRKR